MMPILSDMLWLDRAKVDERKLKSELTVVPEVFLGSPEPVKLFKIIGTQIGVPRAWGLNQKWLVDTYEDRTKFPEVVWPEIQFPEAGGYWTGQKVSIEKITDVFKAGKHGALLDAGCGSGKTIMGLAIAAALDTRVLVVVHKTDLADQWQETGKMFFPAARRGHIQQKHWRYSGKHMVTATAQTLFNNHEVLPVDFKEYFGLVIYDEGHRYPARTFETVLSLFPCRHRLGVSATWRRKDKLECVWNWHIGHTEHRTQSDKLTGNWIQVPWVTSLTDDMFRVRGVMSTAKWISAICENAPYQVWLAAEAIKGVAAGRKLLFVGDRVSQLQDLRRRIIMSGTAATVGLYVGAVDGKTTSKPDREHAKTCDIILATYGMMSEGTDVPALDSLMFVTPRGDVEQVIGRIQRHKEGKRKLLIIDPVFQTDYHMRLAKKRVKVYSQLDFTRHKGD